MSGGAVAIMAIGGVVVWSGLNNVPFLDAVRALAKGQAPQPQRKPAFQPLSGTSASGTTAASGSGSDIVTEAQSWVGKSKYVYGGCHGCTPCAPGQGVDCSSFVTWVMKRTGHYKGKCSMVAGSSMLAWGVKIPANMKQPGDVILWTGTHCAIYAGGDDIIEAACTACGPVRNWKLSKKSKGWIVLRAPDLAKSSDTQTGTTAFNNANSKTVG